MKFIVIFGPPAVGKMTVGYELARLTGFKLFHNHMTIDLVLNFFGFDHPQFRKLVSEFRRRIFEEAATSDLPGLIFTYVWALNEPSDKKFIDDACAIFRQKNIDVYFVELQADVPERLVRNETEFRLAQKAPKRNLEESKKLLLEAEQKYRMNSNNDFLYTDNYVKIDNTQLSPCEVAQRILQTFRFSGVTTHA